MPVCVTLALYMRLSGLVVCASVLLTLCNGLLGTLYLQVLSNINTRWTTMHLCVCVLILYRSQLGLLCACVCEYVCMYVSVCVLTLYTSRSGCVRVRECVNVCVCFAHHVYEWLGLVECAHLVYEWLVGCVFCSSCIWVTRVRCGCSPCIWVTRVRCICTRYQTWARGRRPCPPAPRTDCSSSARGSSAYPSAS